MDKTEDRKAWAKAMLEKLDDVEMDYLENLLHLRENLESVATSGSACDLAESVHSVMVTGKEAVDDLAVLLADGLDTMGDTFTPDEWCRWMHDRCSCGTYGGSPPVKD